MFSLGANAFSNDPTNWYSRLNPEFVRFLHILSAHSISLDVRGEETVEILKKLGITNAVPVGCPTYFETGPNRRIVKRPLTPYDKALGANPWSRVLQDEKDLIAFLCFPQALPRNPRYTPAELYQTTQGQCRCFAGIENWKKFVSQYAFSLFGRMHGGILALNSGVPAVIVNSDLRAREMCRLFHIPHRPDILQPNEYMWRAVYEETDFEPLNQVYPKLYANFMQWLAQQGLGETELAQAHTWAAQQPPFEEPVLHENPQVTLHTWDRLYAYDFYIPTRVLTRTLVKKMLHKLKFVKK